MTRVPGPSVDQLDALADDYAGLIAHSLAAATMATWPLGNPDVEDLATLTDFWAGQVDGVLLPALGVGFEVGAAQIRVGLRDAAGLTAAAWTDVPPAPDALAEAYLATARNRLVDVGDELWSHAREGLLDGLQRGESVPELAARVREAAPDLTEPRAAQIARTEINGAANAGALEQVKATGATGRKEWLAASDSRTRPEHAHADGQVVGVAEKFSVGGFLADRPHDPALPPHLSVSCRCTLSFDLDLESVRGDTGPLELVEAEMEPGQALPPIMENTTSQKRDRSFLARVFRDGLAALVGWYKARTAAAVTTEFHLAGKHDQSTHGHGSKSGTGGSTGGSPSGGKSKSGGGGGGGGGGGRESTHEPVGGQEFDDVASSKKFVDDHYGKWTKSISDEEYGGLRFYQSPGYALMNGQLRGLKKGDIKADVSFNDADLKRASKASRHLKTAIDKAPPLKEKTLVHRGFSADQFGDLKPGMRVQDHGFVSTSLTSDVAAVGRARSPAVARIELPAGTKAGAGSARELILPPGSKFDVVSVTKRGDTTHVDLRLVPDG